MDIFFIIALVMTSVIAVTFIIERGVALRWDKVIPPPVCRAVENYHAGSDLPQMQSICRQHPSTISRLLLFTTEHLDWSKTENVDVLETRARHEVSRLERGLVVLEIIVGIAPLLGLVGTIYGLIVLFGGMGKVTADQTATFARGVSLALNSTLMGLLIAIPALVSWSYYSKKVENLAVEMESLCDEFLRKHYRNGTSLPVQAKPAAKRERVRVNPIAVLPQPAAPSVTPLASPVVARPVVQPRERGAEHGESNVRNLRVDDDEQQEGGVSAGQ